MSKPLITKEQIAARIADVAKEIKGPRTVIAIMKGALFFAADLMRHLDPKCELELIRCTSYTGKTRGELTVEGLEELDLTGRDVLILDDILDSGTTLKRVVSLIQEKKPASLESAVLLRKHPTYEPTYVLFEVPDEFVIGYGLDLNEQLRGLPEIHSAI